MSDLEQTPSSAPEAAFAFSVESIHTIPEKGTYLTGVRLGGEPSVGDFLRFAPAEGPARELRILGVVRRVVGPDGKHQEGKTGLVVEGIDRKELKPPVVLQGLPRRASAA